MTFSVNRFQLNQHNRREAFELTASVNQIHNASELLNRSFHHVSFDILYGMNGQDEEEIAYDIECAVSLGTSNIDIYPIDNVMTQVGLHKTINATKCERTSATRKFSMSVFIDQMMRHSGFMPHNGHGYFRQDPDETIVSNKYSFVYHESVYGYQTHDLMGFGTNAISLTSEYTLTNVRNRDRYVADMSKPNWQPAHSTSRHDVILDYCRPLILRLPYHGKVDVNKIEWRSIPSELLQKLDRLVVEGMVVRDERFMRLTKLGWYWYVNIMYYLMPENEQQYVNGVIHRSMNGGKRTIAMKEVVFDSHIRTEAASII